VPEDKFPILSPREERGGKGKGKLTGIFYGEGGEERIPPDRI